MLFWRIFWFCIIWELSNNMVIIVKLGVRLSMDTPKTFQQHLIGTIKLVQKTIVKRKNKSPQGHPSTNLTYL